MEGVRLRRESVHTVTDARRPMSEDIRYRQRRYLLHMSIRTVCLILAVVAPMPLALRVVLVAAAIVLPYFAVVLANGGREPERPARFGGGPQPRKHEPREVPAYRREIGS